VAGVDEPVEQGNRRQPGWGIAGTSPLLRGSIFTALIPASARTASNEAVNRPPRSRTRNRKSGKFAGAVGSGKVVAAFSGELPKLSNGKCDESQNAQPSAKTAAGTFTATAMARHR
jgi:hypothetical protein